MKANYIIVTTAHTPMESRSDWQKRDEATKRELKRIEADKRLVNTIMECMESKIAEMRKPHGLRVSIEPWEARLILEKGGIVYAKHGHIRERCWLTGDGEMLVGMVPARLVDVTEFDTEIWIFGENE